MPDITIPGVQNDRFHVWSFFTDDNWKTHTQRNYWTNNVNIP